MPVIATDSPDLFCPQCGYNLRGIDSQRCPECGHELDWKALARSRIPWVHRDEIGRWRAYWRTVWLACIDSRIVSDDVSRPVSLGDSRRFRRITVLVATIPLVAVVIGGYLSMIGESGKSLSAAATRPAVRAGWLLEFTVVAAGCLGVYLFLLAATAAPGWFFRPRDMPVIRQNRAVALSQYASAPLALTPLTAAAIVLYALAVSSEQPFHGLPLVILALAEIAAFGLVVVELFGWWLGTVRLLKRTTQCSVARTWAALVGLPLIWAILFGVIAMGIPAAVVFVSLVILSLR